MTGFDALFTHPPLETPLLVQLACVKHAASIHPELASIELSMKFFFFFFFDLRGVSGPAYAHHDYSPRPTGHPASPEAGKAPRG